MTRRPREITVCTVCGTDDIYGHTGMCKNHYMVEYRKAVKERKKYTSEGSPKRSVDELSLWDFVVQELEIKGANGRKRT